jgi:WD40 repeat protein
VWDIAARTQRQVIRPEIGRLRCLSLLRDGNSIVFGGDDDVLMLWKIGETRAALTLSGHRGDIEAVAVDAAGRIAVSGSADHTVRMWDLAKEEDNSVPFPSGGAHLDVVREISLSADGSRVVSGCGEGRLFVWDAPGWGRRELSGHSKGLTALAITRDGRVAVSGAYDHRLCVWDLDSASLLTEFFTEGTVHGCTIANDGLTIAAGDEHGRIHAFHLHGREKTATAGGR